jgi:predicted amidophosphoribosyltransferase
MAVCSSCGMGYQPGATRCANCGASLVNQPQWLTQSDVFWAVFKALLAVSLILGALTALGLLLIYGLKVFGS